MSAMAAIAGAGVGLLLLILSWWLLLVAPASLRALTLPQFALVLLGLGCGAAAGYSAVCFASGPPLWVAIGAWGVWALGIMLLIAARALPPQIVSTILPVSLVGAVIAGLVGRFGFARAQPSNIVGLGLFGAFGGFGILGIGVGALGVAAGLGLRPAGVGVDYYVNVYLRGMNGALWVVFILAACVSAGVPAKVAHRDASNSAVAATLGIALFLVLVVVTKFAFAFYLDCTVGTSLAPFAWIAPGSYC